MTDRSLATLLGVLGAAILVGSCETHDGGNGGSEETSVQNVATADDALAETNAPGFTETCVDELPETCTPLYPPNWDQVYSQTLEKKCALGGGACHSADASKGGLNLSGSDTAYDQLLSPADTTPRILPGDPACSRLVMRLFADELTTVMPLGSPLSTEEKCAIVQWIEEGATR